MIDKYITAADTEAPPEVLRSLVNDSDVTVRRRLAANPKIPIDVLIELSTDSDDEVRVAVGRNPSTPGRVLYRLYRDESSIVRFGLAAEYDIPRDIIEALAQDKDSYVARQARRTLEGLELEQALKHANFVHESGGTAKLGEILVEADLLTNEQVLEMVCSANEAGIPFGRFLVLSRVLPQAVVVKTLSLQLAIRRDKIGLVEAIQELKQFAAKQYK